jgi:hypothetical protein
MMGMMIRAACLLRYCRLAIIGSKSGTSCASRNPDHRASKFDNIQRSLSYSVLTYNSFSTFKLRSMSVCVLETEMNGIFVLLIPTRTQSKVPLIRTQKT